LRDYVRALRALWRCWETGGKLDYQGDHYNTGRETFLLPVSWVDGWPHILEGNATTANARLVVEWMARARVAGCDVIAFPELTLTGYPPEDLLFKPAFIEANLRALADVAKQSRGLTAILGFVDKRDDIFNAAAVLHDGVRAGHVHDRCTEDHQPRVAAADDTGEPVAHQRRRRRGHQPGADVDVRRRQQLHDQVRHDHRQQAA
jgi:hypothetical protein